MLLLICCLHTVAPLPPRCSTSLERTWRPRCCSRWKPRCRKPQTATVGEPATCLPRDWSRASGPSSGKDHRDSGPVFFHDLVADAPMQAGTEPAGSRYQFTHLVLRLWRRWNLWMSIAVNVLFHVHPLNTQWGLTVVARALLTLCLAEILHSREQSPDNQAVFRSYCFGLEAQLAVPWYNPSFSSNKKYTDLLNSYQYFLLIFWMFF